MLNDTSKALILLIGSCLFVAACDSGSELKPLAPENAIIEKSWLEDETSFSNERGSVVFRPTEEEEASIKQVIRDFLGARSSQDLALLIREPERVMPMVEAHYRTHSFISGGVHVDPQFRAAGRYIFTKVTLDGAKARRLLALEKTDAGYKVNWELFVHMSSEFLTTQ